MTDGVVRAACALLASGFAFTSTGCRIETAGTVETPQPLSEYAWDRPSDAYVATQGGDAFLRLDPTPSSARMTVANGSRVAQHGCEIVDAQGQTWCRVEVGGNRGWMSDATLVTEPPATRSFAVDPAPVVRNPVVEAEQPVVWVVESADGFANLRSGPTLGAAVLTRVAAGESVRVHECDVRDARGRSWCRASHGPTAGWIAQEFVSIVPVPDDPAERLSGDDAGPRIAW